MKKEEIEKLPAGIELDVFIAEKVMGWTPHYPIKMFDGTETMRSGFRDPENATLYLPEQLAFSKDEESALTVLRKFPRWRIETAGEDKIYVVIQADRESRENLSENLTVSGYWIDESIPLAICRAAVQVYFALVEALAGADS